MDVLSKFPPPAGGVIFKNKFKIPAPAPFLSNIKNNNFFLNIIYN